MYKNVNFLYLREFRSASYHYEIYPYQSYYKNLIKDIPTSWTTISLLSKMSSKSELTAELANLTLNILKLDQL